MTESKQIKEKQRRWEENDCPWWKWIISVVLTVIASIIPSSIISIISPMLLMSFSENSGIINLLSTLIPFIFLFWFQILFIKVICKTSVWSFILGRERHNDRKAMWIVAGLFIVGLGITYLISITNLMVNPEATFKKTVLMILVSAAIIWMQTSLEEFWFRGIIGRIFFKNELKQKISGKTVAYIIVSSAAFAAMHLANPEVLNVSGVDLIFMVGVYVIPGIMFAITTVQFGSLLPGMIMHAINNFLTCWLVGPEVSALQTQPILLDVTKENVGMWSFFITVVCYIPFIIYMIVRNVRAKNASVSD